VHRLTLACVLFGVTVLTTAAGCSSSGPTGSASPQRAEPGGTAAATYADWPTYHNDIYRGGYASTMPAAKGTPTVVTKLALDGAVYASPIIVHGVTILATENNTVYAFSPSYTLLWKRHLGPPSPAAQRPCGNIDLLGITGTPVYVASTGLVFVAPEFTGNPPTHRLYAISATTGAVSFSHSLDLPGADQRVMQQRAALTAVRGRIYVPFGGLLGDCGNYKGRVIGYRWTGKGSAVSYTVPTAREAGIWAPPGPVADRAGHILVAVGNGASGVGDAYDHSDSVLELSPTMTLTDSFSPSTWPTDNDADQDLGSQGPALIGRFVFIAGKSGTAYVLNRDRLGGIGGQVSKANLCRSSFGGVAAVGYIAYVPCTDGLRAITITSSGTIQRRWHASSSISGSPVVGGGRVWSLDTGAGVLHALDPTTGNTRASVSVGAVTRFATPAIYGRDMAIPTTSGATIVRTS